MATNIMIMSNQYEKKMIIQFKNLKFVASIMIYLLN